MYLETHWEGAGPVSMQVSEIASGRYGCHEVKIETVRSVNGEHNVVSHTMTLDQLVQLRDAIALHLLMRDVRERSRTENRGGATQRAVELLGAEAVQKLGNAGIMVIRADRYLEMISAARSTHPAAR